MAELGLNKGRIWVDIGAKFKGKEFKITTPLGTAMAKGTEFGMDVEPENNRMGIGVLESEVKVG